MDKRFKRFLVDISFERILILLMAVSFAFILLVEDPTAVGQKEQYPLATENQFPGIMRFHVIANSDSLEDQELKLKVRDYVLERLQLELVDVSSENMRQYIADNMERIEGWAKESLRSNNSTYDCSASVGIRHIPAKRYDDLFFPEGNYEALTITIGSGQGQNWWCVVFPPLCLIDGEESPYDDKLDMSEEEKLELKSKIVEILKSHDMPSTSTHAISSIFTGIYKNQFVDAIFC